MISCTHNRFYQNFFLIPTLLYLYRYKFVYSKLNPLQNLVCIYRERKSLQENLNSSDKRGKTTLNATWVKVYWQKSNYIY